MIKNILKEVVIVLLLCMAILLILSIMFYDYNPITKVVPNKIAYNTPDDIAEIIQEEGVNTNIETEKRVYTIDGSDLNIYQRSQTYDPSKENPFVSAPVSTSETTSTEVKVNTDGSQTTTADTSSSSSSSSGIKKSTGAK